LIGFGKKMGESSSSEGFVPLVTVVGFHHARYAFFSLSFCLALLLAEEERDELSGQD
jgi:hypothetical protein